MRSAMLEPSPSPLKDVRAVLLAGVRGFFLNVMSWRSKKRQIIDGDTFSPRARSRRTRISSSVRSGSRRGNVRVTTGPLRMAQRAPTERRPLGPECAPLGQRTGSSMFVNLASDEMTLMIELVVDLSVN